MFLGWYDPDPKRPVPEKVADAIAAYRRKFGRAPIALIVNPDDEVLLVGDANAAGLETRTAPFVPRHTFYVGAEERAHESVEAGA